MLLSAAGENLDAKLIFQHPNLLADPRLGSIRKPSAVEETLRLVINHFNNVTKLLQLQYIIQISAIRPSFIWQT